MKKKILAITLLCFGAVTITEDAQAFKNRVKSHKQSDKVKAQQARQAAKYQAKLVEKKRKTEVRKQNVLKNTKEPYDPLPYGIRSMSGLQRTNQAHIFSASVMKQIIETLAEVITGLFLTQIEDAEKETQLVKPKAKVKAIEQELPQRNTFRSRPQSMGFDLMDLYGN